MDYSIIVGSLGRCGSSALFAHILGKLGQSIAEFVPRLGPDVRPGVAYKTHDYAPRLVLPVRAVFLFGDPIATVVSAHALSFSEFVIPHYVHMGADVARAANFRTEDTMNLEAHFDSWYRPQLFPSMTIRYESMFDHLDEISDFLGVSLRDFAQLKRNTDWKKLRQRAELEHTFGPLSDKITAAKDIVEWAIAEDGYVDSVTPYRK